MAVREILHVGNPLLRQRSRDITRDELASPEVQQHREKLYGAGCTAGCYNHSLYEFSVSTGESHRVGWVGSTVQPQIG